MLTRPKLSALFACCAAMRPTKKQRCSDAHRDWFQRLQAVGLSYDDATAITQLAVSNRDSLAEFEGVPAQAVKKIIRNCSTDQIDHMLVTTHVDCHDGSEFPLQFIDPNQLVASVLNENRELRAEFFKCMAASPMPWHLVYGLDECWSGNILAESGRKCWVLSFSFEELMPDRMSKSVFWFTPCVVRSKVVSSLQGGISGVFRMLLRRHLFDECNGGLTSGLALQHDGRAAVLMFRFGQLLGDGDALRAVVEWKGAGGLRCCVKCANCWSKGSGIARRHRPNQHEITCSEASKSILHSQSSLRQVTDDLLAANREVHSETLSNTDFKNLQKVCGFAPSPTGVWSDGELIGALRFPQSITYDWPHCCLQEGVLSNELPLYCKALGSTAGQFNSFLNDWTLCDGMQRRSFKKLKEVVSSGAAQGHNRPTCTEYLGFVAAIRCWLVISEDASPRGLSLGRLCSFIAEIQKAKKLQQCGPAIRERLVRSWSAWLAEHTSNLGHDLVKPKSHWLMHVGEFERVLIDCLVIERLHRRCKAFSKGLPSNAKWEGTLLARVYAHQCNDIGASRVQMFDTFQGRYSASCLVNGCSLRKGTFLLCDCLVGQFLACQVSGQEVSITVQLCCHARDPALKNDHEFFSFVSLDPSRSAEWKASSCRRALAFKAVNDTDYLLLYRP